MTSSAALDIALDAAHQATLLFLQAPTGCLAVGAGHPTHSVVLYRSEHDATGPLHALGDPNASDEGWDPPLVFRAGDHDVAFTGRCAVPASQARAIARLFLEDAGRLPDVVEWEAEGAAPSR